MKECPVPGRFPKVVQASGVPELGSLGRRSGGGAESDPWGEGCGWDPCVTHHTAREAAAGLEWGLLRSGGLRFSDERPDVDTWVTQLIRGPTIE